MTSSIGMVPNGGRSSQSSRDMNTWPVTIIDYGAGNIRSVVGALTALNQSVQVTSDLEVVSGARCLVLPGVGSFGSAIENIKARGLDEGIRRALSGGASILGICLGMQLLGQWSEEDGGCEGLGIAPGVCERFLSTPDLQLRVPHMGFNSVTWIGENSLFSGVPTGGDFYFVHSYRFADPGLFPPSSVATTEYGGMFVSSFALGDRIFGTQFHPELSQGNGLRVLSNFLRQSQC